jgi:hypothetical protein
VGHLYYPRRKLLEVASQLLETDGGIIEQAIEAPAQSGDIVLTAIAGDSDKRAVYLKSLHTAERGVARLLLDLLASPVAPITIDIERAIT